MHSDIDLVARLIIGLVFALSAVSKALHPRAFLQGVLAYGMLPQPLSYLVGLLLIPWEATISVTHFAGWMLPAVVPSTLVTIGVFATAVATQLVRGRPVPCLCFDSLDEQLTSSRTLIRLGLLAICEFTLLVVRLSSDSFLPLAAYDSRVLLMAFAWANLMLVIGMWLISAGDFRSSWPITSAARPWIQ